MINDSLKLLNIKILVIILQIFFKKKLDNIIVISDDEKKFLNYHAQYFIKLIRINIVNQSIASRIREICR